VIALALVVLMVAQGLAQGFAAPSGCRTTALKNTLEFTEVRSGNPGDKHIVIGAFTVHDDATEDTGVVEKANCVPPGPIDGHPTYVTAIRVTLVGGDLIASDVRALKLFIDGNEDGFLQVGQDTQLGDDLAGTCLFSECLFSFGRTTALFTIPNSDYLSFLITADLGPNARDGANLMINVTAEANDIVTLGATSISSDFNDTFRSQASNIILNGLDGPALLRSLNNGSGNPETGYKAVEFTGIKTRFRENEVKPGTREVIAAIIYFCEGGQPLTPRIVIKTYYAVSTPTIAGYPGALACLTTIAPDELATRLLRVRVGVSGNPGAVGTLRLYDDANDNGRLFEDGEFVLSSYLSDGVSVFGSLNNPLLSGTRPSADPTPGVFSAQTKPTTLCDSSERNPQPDGVSQGCPHVLVLTFDVNSNAPTGEVIFDIAFDVGNLPGEVSTSPTASSNLMSTAPTRSRVTITGGSSSIEKSLAQFVAEHSGDKTLIDDTDILWAISFWVKSEPLKGVILDDTTILNLIRLWAEGKAVTASENFVLTQIQDFFYSLQIR
jgi:hypothetical protein